jgi:protein arginine N-methyltransferase 7
MSEEDLRMGASNFAYSGFEGKIRVNDQLQSNLDMLLDDERNSKYRNAIQLAVRQKLNDNKEAHVLDIGSGTGLLSLYAAEAGATSVTSIELDPVIFDVSVKIAKRASYDDRIKFINVESLELGTLDL